MGSGVQQRGFLFTDVDNEAIKMEAEKLFCGDNAEASLFSANKTTSSNRHYMAAANRCSVDLTKSKREESHTVEVGSEVRDDCEEFTRQGGEKATAAELMSMLQLQQFRCALTGQMLTPEVARCDHVIPVSEGGSNQIDNLQWVTDDVNRAKGVMSQEHFIAMCIKVAKWAQR